MTIEAKVICDSISPHGIRLVTMQLRYPRFIHAEFMTHRVFSRNASSSRAIPVERMIADLRRDPAMPVFWGSNKPGMQAGDEIVGHMLEQTKQAWLDQMETAIETAEWMVIVGQLHKQIANRILEPWAHINVVVTATEWDNFFTLRAHKDAQPEMHALALAMFNAMAGSHPIHLKPGQWHLPYVSEGELQEACARHVGDPTDNPHTLDHMIDQDLIKCSVARCARVSYLTHDGRATTLEEDIALYEKLVGGVPLHASPAEHQATPDQQNVPEPGQTAWHQPALHGNFNGWIQYRKTIEDKFQ